MRQKGIPYEKKFIELSQEDRDEVTSFYHAWQQVGWQDKYHDIPEFCYAATIKEIEDNSFSLIPSKYIRFENKDEKTNFDEKIAELQKELGFLFKEEEQTRSDLFQMLSSFGLDLK